MKFDMTDPRRVRATVGATAWLNAAIASGSDKERRVLYRTLLVEFYRTGIQFVGCDGTLLFRTWAPYVDIGDLGAPQPGILDTPEDSVIVADTDRFALGFMKTLLSACSNTVEALTVAVERADAEEEPALGEDLSRYVLTLQAVHQRLSCPLFEGTFPHWRVLEFGVDAAERVEGMTLAPRMFKAVGQLKGVNGVDLTFRGDDKVIDLSAAPGSEVDLRGVMAPMRRQKASAPDPEDDRQISHADGEDPFPEPKED